MVLTRRYYRRNLGAMNTSNPIREAREAKGLTLTETARRAGVSKATMSQWENGKMLPRPARAARLIKVLPSLSLNKIYSAATQQAA